MKAYLLLFTLFVFSNTQAQDVALCSHSKDVNGNQGITYYQYPSMNKYDIRYLKLDLAVETNSRVISGTALTVARTLATLDSFIIELRNNMLVDSVYINGVKLPFTHSADHIYVPLITSLPTGSTINALIFYRGTAGSNGVYAGTVASNGLNYTATLSESYQAREWFPAKQILTDKIDSADLWFTTSAINKVGSNGLLQSVVPMPAGKVQYRWKEKHPMNYYMPSFSVGNYMEYLNYAKPVSMAPDSVMIQHYIVNNPTYFASIKVNLDKTPVFLEKMSELFTLYPFADEKYGHAHANIGGGMEHQTMSTMAGFTSTLIAHELGHQWWGDNVTCATWNHIWLNEGLASYCEYLMIEHFPALIPSTNPSLFMQGFHNNAMSQPGGSVYVPDASLYDEGRIFSYSLSYSKGAAVTHNLRFEIQNDNLFYQGLRNFQQQFKDSVATTNDFKTVMETTSGKNLTDFFNQWIYGQGYPTINVTFFKEGTSTLVLRLNQITSMPAVTPFFKGLYEFRISSAQGDTTVKVYMSTNNQEFRFNYNKTPSNVIIDPNNWVMNLSGTIINLGVMAPASQVDLSGSGLSDCSAVMLTWTTTNEHNISKYEIEFSTDNIQFTKDPNGGEVAGTNTNTNQVHTYQYQIVNPSPTYYFRLKIIDTLGFSRYSDTVSVQVLCPGIKIGPIPARNNLNVFVTTLQAGTVNITLTNNLGEVLYKATESVISGVNTIPVKIMPRLPASTYILTVTFNGSTFTRKVLKL